MEPKLNTPQLGDYVFGSIKYFSGMVIIYGKLTQIVQTLNEAPSYTVESKFTTSITCNISLTPEPLIQLLRDIEEEPKDV